MQKRLRGSKRVILKKVTALNLFADQATQVQAIMEATGAQEVAPLVRELLDEALAARRRKSIHREEVEQPPPTQDVAETLQTIQTLLLRIIEQGQTHLRIQRLTLELLQEAIVEARAGRMSLWETVAAPALRERGSSAQQVADLFEAKTEEAQDYSYGLAEQIRDQLVAEERDSESATVDDDDRQGQLIYDHSDAPEN